MPISAVQLRCYQKRQQRGNAANVSRDRNKRFRHGRMLLRQSFETCTDIVKLVNFVQNCFESHGLCPFLLGLRGRKTSDGLLSSEDLKEGKGGDYLMFDCSRSEGACLVQIDQ